MIRVESNILGITIGMFVVRFSQGLWVDAVERIRASLRNR